MKIINKVVFSDRERETLENASEILKTFHHSTSNNMEQFRCFYDVEEYVPVTDFEDLATMLEDLVEGSLEG